MNPKVLYVCGLLAPAAYIVMTIVGGALRPGYSHLSDTVSELLSPGSPNRPLLGVSTDRPLLAWLSVWLWSAAVCPGE